MNKERLTPLNGCLYTSGINRARREGMATGEGKNMN